MAAEPRNTRAITGDLRAARAALTAQDWRAAHAACTRVLADVASGAGAHHAEALALLAELAAHHGNDARAADLQARALSIPAAAAPLRFRLHVLAAQRASRRRDHDIALAAADAAASIAADAAARPAPDTAIGTDARTHAHLCDTLGVVLARAGEHERARAWFQRACSGAPDVAAHHYNLATALQFTGDTAGATIAYTRALELEPTRWPAYPALAQLGAADEPAFVARVDAALAAAEARDDAEACQMLGHARALVDARRGDPAAEMASLARAKARLAARGRRDPAEDAALFDAADAALRAADTPTASRALDDAPIFVFGLPRSGTTLLERILGRHPRVRAAGELGDFSAVAKALSGTPGHAVLDAATVRAAVALDPTRLGEAYLQRTRRQRGGHAHFVDKMPLNLFHAAAIRRALPNARILCLRRHPLDVCLGNYRQLFGARFAYYDYALDLGTTAHYVARFEALLAAIERASPADRFLRVDYDALVADQRGQTERLLAFCGLPWDEACLSFERSSAAVATASALQVRRPMYRDASGRWRAYAQALAPARAILEQAGVDLGPDG